MRLLQSYLSLFCLKMFPLCTPAWQCSCVIIDRTTVSGNTSKAFQLYLKWTGSLQWWTENFCPSLVTRTCTEWHNLSQASRWCQEMFYASTAIPSVWGALLLCHSNLGGTNRPGQGSVPSWQTYPAPVFQKAVTEASGTQEDTRCGHHPWVQNMLLGKGFL